MAFLKKQGLIDYSLLVACEAKEKVKVLSSSPEMEFEKAYFKKLSIIQAKHSSADMSRSFSEPEILPNKLKRSKNRQKSTKQ